MKIRKADPRDVPKIEALLSTVGLPNGAVAETLENCLIAADGAELVGTIAIDCLGDWALLKSFAVSPDFQGRGWGKALFERMLPVALQNKIQQLFLLTTTAECYLSKLNFKAISREQVPEAIAETIDFKEICPSQATCMTLNLSEIMHYYPRGSLDLKPDIAGVKLWSVSLEKTQFTYFEVEPNKEFEMHVHESEQITHVLEGELFFKTDIDIVCVKAGETIAIPSNLRHGAFTKDLPLKAVDAWSPINSKYE